MCRVIDLVKTGKNIERLLAERGLTAKDVQQRLGFAERRPVYFWLAGKNLPSIDNLFILTEMLQVPIDEILIAKDEYIQQRGENSHERNCSSAREIGFSDRNKRCKRD